MDQKRLLCLMLCAVIGVAWWVTACSGKAMPSEASESSTEISIGTPTVSIHTSTPTELRTQVPVPSVLPTASPAPKLLPTQWRFQVTTVAKPSRQDLFEGSALTTDGRLVFYIEETTPKCHTKTEPIEIRVTFYNLASDPLVFQSSLVIDNQEQAGYLFTWLTTSDGTPALTRFDMFPIIPWVHYPENNFRELLPQDSFQATVIYHFPSEIGVGDDAGKITAITPSPGQYFLRLTYDYQWYEEFEEQPKPDDLWTGQIASNRIEICIVEGP